MLGFRYPFLDGSFSVSNKNLRDPNGPLNITIKWTNIFGINMSIVIPAQHIRWVIFPCKIIVSGGGDSGLTGQRLRPGTQRLPSRDTGDSGLSRARNDL